MRHIKSILMRNRDGQSLIETALMLPLLLAIVFNAVNIGYFLFVYLNMATAPRQGAEYSIQGNASYLQLPNLPSDVNVYNLVSGSITGAIASAAGTPIRVCTLYLEVNPTYAGTSNQIPNCNVYPLGSSGNFPTDPYCTATPFCPDPEAPNLVLNRVDIQYTVTPLIQGAIFNLVFPPSLTFHRFVYMRAEGL